MSFRKLSLIGMFALMALLLKQASATSVEPPSFTSLVAESDYVVRGVVTAVTPEWREANGRPYIGTKVEVEVLEVIRGTPPKPLILDIVGGKIGDVELTVDGAPKFSVGDDDILFIKNNGTALSPLVGIMYGRYPLLRDAKTGETHAVRANGMPLYSEQDVAQPMMKLSAYKQRYTGAKPLTAATFIAKIRDTSARNPTVTHEK